MNHHAWLQKHPSPLATGGEFHWYPDAGDRELRAGFVERVRGLEPPAVLWLLERGRAAWGQVFSATAPVDGRRYVGLALSVVEGERTAADLLAQLAPPAAAPWTDGVATESSGRKLAAQELAALRRGLRADAAAGVVRALLSGGSASVGDPTAEDLPQWIASIERVLPDPGRAPRAGVWRAGSAGASGDRVAELAAAAWSEPASRRARAWTLLCELAIARGESVDRVGAALVAPGPAASEARGEGGRDARGEEGRDARGEGGRDARGEGGRDARGEGGRDARGEGGRDACGEGGRDPRDDGGRDPRDEGGRDPRDEGGRDPRGEGGRDARSEGGMDACGEGGRNASEGGRDPRGEGGRDPRGEAGRDPRGEGGRDLRGELAPEAIDAAAVLTAEERAGLAGRERVVEILHAWGRGRLDRSPAADTLPVRLADLVALRVIARLAADADPGAAIAEARWHALLPARRRHALLAAVARRTASLRALVEASHA